MTGIGEHLHFPFPMPFLLCSVDAMQTRPVGDNKPLFEDVEINAIQSLRCGDSHHTQQLRVKFSIVVSWYGMRSYESCPFGDLVAVLSDVEYGLICQLGSKLVEIYRKPVWLPVVGRL